MALVSLAPGFLGASSPSRCLAGLYISSVFFVILLYEEEKLYLELCCHGDMLYTDSISALLFIISPPMTHVVFVAWAECSIYICNITL